MASRATIRLNSDNLQAKLRQGGPRAFAYVRLMTRYYSTVIEMRARQDARWTDQTGNARNGLTGQPFISGSYNGGAEFAIVLYHKVPYGIWLETRDFSHKGDLGIIKPTLDAVRDDYFGSVQSLFRRMFG